MPTPRVALSPHLGSPHWLAALLFGLMLVLLVLIVSWFLRARAPVDPALNVTMIETDAPLAARPPPDITPALRASLNQTMADGKTLSGVSETSSRIESKVASCKPPPFRADRWAKKDLKHFSRGAGCWVTTQEGGGERSAAPSEKTIARLRPLGCVSTPMGTGKSKRPWCARSQVQFIVRGQLRRNSRMMERSRQRLATQCQRGLRRVGNIKRPHAGASMTIMRCVGRRISPQTTHPALGSGKMNFGAMPKLDIRTRPCSRFKEVMAG